MPFRKKKKIVSLCNVLPERFRKLLIKDADCSLISVKNFIGKHINNVRFHFATCNSAMDI